MPIPHNLPAVFPQQFEYKEPR